MRPEHTALGSKERPHPAQAAPYLGSNESEELLRSCWLRLGRNASRETLVGTEDTEPAAERPIYRNKNLYIQPPVTRLLDLGSQLILHDSTDLKADRSGVG